MDNLICYCFGYSAEDIKNDVHVNGKSLIMENIIRKKSSADAIVLKQIPKKGDVLQMSAV